MTAHHPPGIYWVKYRGESKWRVVEIQSGGIAYNLGSDLDADVSCVAEWGPKIEPPKEPEPW
jgi:hypothetical protein